METKFGGFCGFVTILPKLVPAKDNFFCAPPNLFLYEDDKSSNTDFE